MARARILIVANDSAVATTLGDRLKALDYTVLDLASTLEAVAAMVEFEAPDLVLLDVDCTAGENGADALRWIRSRLPVPVIFLAPSAGDPRLSGIRLTSPLDCLTPPVADPLLEGAIEMALCRRNTETALSTARKHEAISILAGGLAHDFNNLLSGMLGYIELAQMGMDPQNRGFQHLTKAKDTCQRAVSLMQQFMTIARRPFHPLPEGDLPALLQDVADEVLKITAVSVEWVVADDLKTAVYDETLMRRAFIEVFTNAANAMPDGGRITVALENLAVDQPDNGSGIPYRAGDYVRIAICDTGEGISVVDPERLFAPHVQANGADAPVHVGLGLAVTHSILKKHKGQVAVVSSPGKGTTVTLLVPARK